MKSHPFSAERFVGLIHKVDGSNVQLTLPSAAALARSQYGERIARGEVGEFLIVDVGGLAIFGRITHVEVVAGELRDLSPTDKTPMSLGRLQLLSSLKLDGDVQRGIARYPRIGDSVYVASDEVIQAIISTGPLTTDENSQIDMGRLSVGESVEVRVPISKLFGKHLAVLGATGSGKSWTLAHLAESVVAKRGKFLLIDATGEFRTLGELATHLTLGNSDSEPEAILVGLPHYLMRETDRNAFLNPSSGAQLPKLRDATRSLKLAAILKQEGNTAGMLDGKGQLIKAPMQPNSTFLSFSVAHAARIEHPHSPFDITQLAEQVIRECIWPPENGKFGKVDTNGIGYQSTLISRINDMLQTPEIMNVVNPAAGVPNVVDEIGKWMRDSNSHVLRISLRNLTFSNNLREIIVNVIGQSLLTWARAGKFSKTPLVVGIDEAHQFFGQVVGDEFASAQLTAFDSIAKEGRKYGLTICLATQRPGDLPSGVLSQVGMMLVHRLADGKDRQKVEQAAAEIDLSATKLLPGLIPGEAIFMGVDFPVPISVRVKRPIHEPSSDGPDYAIGWGDPMVARLRPAPGPQSQA